MRGSFIFKGVPIKWFKHYENAHTNRFIQALLAEKNGHELHSMYWLFMGLLCSEFKKDSSEFILSIEQIRSRLHVVYDRKAHRFMEVLGEFSSRFDEDLFNLERISEKFYKIDSPIILELMGKEFKRKRQSSGSATPKKKEERIKKENKNKEIDIRHLAPKPPAPDYDFFMDTWNNLLGESLKPIQKMTDKRKALIRALLKNYPDFNLFNYLKEIESSDFLMGANSNWSADFDFCFKHSNYLKVIEGNYKNNKNQKSIAELRQDKMLGILKGFENADSTNNN